MTHDRFDEWLDDAARDYNAPPETPREEIWARLQAARRREEPPRRSGGPAVRRWMGIAALIALGVGIGYLAQRPGAAPVPLAATGAEPGEAASRSRGGGDNTVYRLAVSEYLSQSEAFLTLFRRSVERGGDRQLAARTARQLLATNRMLLDSQAADDPKARVLLEDLELVLAQIAQLPAESGRGELELIQSGIDQVGVLSRLRTAVPSGIIVPPTQGAM